MRRVGMGEINVNNTRNFIHKSSFLKQGLTRFADFLPPNFFIYHLAQRRARRSIRVIRAIRVSFFISHRFHRFFLLPFVIYHLAFSTAYG